MRHLALALALLAACAADPVLPPRDCTPGQTSACACAGGATGVQTCGASGALGACVCPDGGGAADVVDASSPVDVVAAPEDRPAAVDTGAPDVASGVDVVDAGVATDVDPRHTPECRAVIQTCDGRTVDVQRGEPDGGVTHHCGRCGNTCPAGFGCLTCVCIRL